jgi:DUF1365 family protein
MVDLNLQRSLTIKFPVMPFKLVLEIHLDFLKICFKCQQINSFI